MSKQSVLLNNVIYYDFREERSLVIKYLKKYDVKLIKKDLDVGDYVVKNYVIERKDINDLINSILDGRIYKQIENLKDYNSILLIEGNLYILPQEDLKRVYSVIARAINNKINVIYSINQEYTAYFLYKLSIINNNPSFIPIGKKGYDKYEIAIRILTQLPGIGIKKAKEILKYYGSLKNFINSDIKDLMKLKLGSKRIKEIKEIFEHEFK